VFRVVQPSPLSRDIVDCFWLCSDALTAASDDTFEVLPDGCVELVFALDDSRGRMIVFGTATRGCLFPTQPGTVYLGMRLRPARLGGLVEARADSLTDRHGQLDALGGRPADSLLQQLSSASSMEAQVSVLEQHVRQAWRPHPRLGALDRALASIRHHAGSIRVESLADEISLSRRQLERQFRHAIGLTPKQYCRVVRFQHALSRLGQGKVNRAALAAELGFSDQSHLRRDFIALASRAMPAP
jgi:AraC-like DNA-binding protein